MIVSIEGTLEKAAPLWAVVNVGGIGYLVNIPVTTAEKLPQTGQRVKLHTSVVYREESQSIHGFSTEAERDFFELLIHKVSGVGPKVAQSILSKLSLESLADAIGSGDAKLLAKTPGIGAKTAERIIVELKDKLAGVGSHGRGSATGPQVIASGQATSLEDAILALLALGYKPAEAKKSAEKALASLGKGASTEAIIKSALG